MSDYDPTDLSGQNAGRSKGKEREKARRAEDEADFKWLMGTRRGRRIVWRRLERAKVFHSSFNTNSMAMAFAEGMKNEGLYELGMVHLLCPDLYPVMLKENQNDGRNPDDDERRNDP